MTSQDVDYCLLRARQEAQKALKCQCSEAASAHRSLSMRYSTRALMLSVAENEDTEIEDKRVAV